MSTTVSFVIGVLNERHRLPRVLQSIRAQSCFSADVEIVVSDGGSTDGTRELAEAAGCRVIDNPLRRCEPGIALGIDKAKGDVVIVMAADNPLLDDRFLERLLKPFEDPTISAAFPLVVATEEDPATVAYLNCFTDPLNHFVYWNAAAPATFKHAYRVLEQKPDYVVYDFTAEKKPLLALAQGFAFRRSFQRPAGSEEDDIRPVEALIESGGRIAFVPGARIAHHTVSNYRDFIEKFEPRIAARLKNRNMPVWQRHVREPLGRRMRRMLWPLYATSFILPAVVAMYGVARDRRKEWLMHPFLSFGLALAFWRVIIRFMFERAREVTFGHA